LRFWQCPIATVNNPLIRAEAFKKIIFAVVGFYEGWMPFCGLYYKQVTIVNDASTVIGE
jgi:hypothetical protein